jgi:signal transduction histidine kinase
VEATTPKRPRRQLPIGWIAVAVGLIGLAAIDWGDLHALASVNQRLSAIDEGELPQTLKAHRLARDVDQVHIHVEGMIAGPAFDRDTQRLAVVAATNKLRQDAARFGVLAETPSEARLWKDLGGEIGQLDKQVAAVVRLEGPGPILGPTASNLRDELRRLVWDCDQLVDIGTSQAALQSRLLQADARSASRLQLLTSGAVALLLTLLLGWAQLAARRHARQLQDYTETLERVNAELEAFAGRIAHDLQSPLAPIQGNAELIARGVDPAKARELGARIVKTTGRVAELVDGLLAFAAGAKPGSAECDAAEVLGSVLADFGDRLKSSGARVEVSVKPTPVRCSKALLASVFQNLLDNALKYGRKDDQSPSVSVIVRPMGYQGLISVADAGEGMPDEVRRRAFEPFFRGGARGPGHGLGLATVRRIVEGHGGVVSIESETGAGTRLRVLLPAPGPVARA